jgi:predicted RNA-binding protein with TRAM domain
MASDLSFNLINATSEFFTINIRQFDSGANPGTDTFAFTFYITGVSSGTFNLSSGLSLGNKTIPYYTLSPNTFTIPVGDLLNVEIQDITAGGSNHAPTNYPDVNTEGYVIIYSLLFTLDAATTTSFTINMTQFESAASPSTDTFTFTFYISGTKITPDYTIVGLNSGSQTINYSSLSPNNFTVSAGQYLNVVIKDTTVIGGTARHPYNYLGNGPTVGALVTAPLLDLSFNLISANTTSFTINIIQLDSAAQSTDIYQFTLWINGTGQGPFVYNAGSGGSPPWNPSTGPISVLYDVLGGTPPSVGDTFNVQIQDVSAGGANTSPNNYTNLSSGVTVTGGSPPCFPRGTPILTSAGYVPVETLTNDDTVRTADGRDVSIKLLHFTVKKADQITAPYRIMAGALGHYYPPQDLCLSAIHAIQDSRGVWQMPKYLARHNSMVQQYGLGEPVEYFHIECPDFFKDNLVVAGATVESFKNKQGPSGAVYVWNKELNGFIRNDKEKIAPVPKHPNTVMVYA